MKKITTSDLTREQKGDLIVDLISFALGRDRIWCYDRPQQELAALIGDIVEGTNDGSIDGGYLNAELKKAPKELLDKLKPYL